MNVTVFEIHCNPQILVPGEKKLCLEVGYQVSLESVKAENEVRDALQRMR